MKKARASVPQRTYRFTLTLEQVEDLEAELEGVLESLEEWKDKLAYSLVRSILEKIRQPGPIELTQAERNILVVDLVGTLPGVREDAEHDAKLGESFLMQYHGQLLAVLKRLACPEDPDLTGWLRWYSVGKLEDGGAPPPSADWRKAARPERVAA